LLFFALKSNMPWKESFNMRTRKEVGDEVNACDEDIAFTAGGMKRMGLA
jgi:hypothetical protein